MQPTNLNFANPQSLAIGGSPQLGDPTMSDQSLTIPNPENINMSELIQEWQLSTEYVRLYTRDFKFLDDLVDGVPLSHDPKNPFVGDTTLLGEVKSIPRDSLQQLPVIQMAINGTKNSVAALLASYLLKHTAFNEDTFGKGLLSTLQIGAEQALSHGYAPFMVATGVMFNNFGTTLKLLHYMDTAPEPGIQDHNETGFDYTVANLTPSRVRKILKAAMRNPNTSWNIPALKAVLASTPLAPTYSMYEGAARNNQPGEQAGPTYQFVTRYETGQDATIITFCPQVTDAPLRVMDSRSKWGYPRVIYLVIDPAALTPFGQSRVRLASPNVNLMNIYYGQIAAMLLLNSAPPVFQKGRFSTPVVLKQKAVWKAIDPQASAELKNMDNGALEQFVPMAEFFQAQIKTVMGRPAMSGPSSPGKTAPGVEETTEQSNTAVNQITKILENFLRQYSLVALDTMLSEQEGEDDIIVDDETKTAINNLRPGTIGDDNKIHMVWADFYNNIETWSAEVTVSLSQDQLKDKKRAEIQDTMTVLAQNVPVLGPSAAAKVDQLSDVLMEDAVSDTGPVPPPGGGMQPMTPAQAASPMPPNPAVAPQQ